ncbi:apolipoprotein D-like [Coccinella septempunctata]|uniref:apolipoprotein D-like n=1 Tax=Coccinella septempunctata TaxID=41139 RepID=UPI001D074131|nr:apolipoprotein D-like [Coccinella septempunctata]
MWKLLAIWAICICEIWCQVPFFGKCPEIDSVQKNFDLNKYTGRWFEAEKYFANFELGKKCIFADYSLFENGTMKVLNQDININTHKKSSIEGNARPAGDDKEGKLLVNFPRRGVRVDAPYWVLETDYDSYAVVWACSEYPMVSTKYAWILTRKRDPSEETLKKAYQVFERLNLSKKDLFKTDQKDCPIDE